jgi:EF hand
MTANTTKKSHSRIRASLQQDFIPNFEMRSMVVIAVFAASAAAVRAQTTLPPHVSTVSTVSTVSVSAAADRTDRPAERMVQVRSAGNPLDAAFKRADTNGDGKLSRKEAEHFPMLSQRFDLIDGNGDAFISREEFDQAISN